MFRTFSAACMIAAASAFELKSVPEWTAGFVAGMVGENHLTEFQACYQGGDNLAKEAIDAFEQIVHGHVIKGAKEAKAVFDQFPTAFATCKNIGDDLKAVEDWAKIFNDPVHLAHLATKHAIIHEKQIQKDFQLEKADWAAGNYYHSGLYSADMVQILIGPVKKAYLDAKYKGLAFNPVSVPEYVAGLMYGLTGENHLDELTKCLNTGDDLLKQAKVVAEDFEGKHIIHGFEDLGTLASMLAPAMETCEGMDDDIQQIKNWAQIWHQPAHLMERIAKNWLLYHFPIHKDMKTVEKDWKAGDYFGSGEASADFLTKILTPGLPASVVPKILSGFLYKFVGDNNLANVEKCFKDGKNIEIQLSKAVADFEKGGKINQARAIMLLKSVVAEIPTEFATCKGMETDVKAIEEWAKLFTNRAKLAAKISKNMALHHKQITSDIATFKADMKAQAWFKAGEDLADLLAVAVGTVESEAPTMVDMPVLAPPKFIAGFMKEFVQENDLQHIETCAQGAASDGKFIKQAIQAAEQKDYSGVIAALEQFVAALPSELQLCKSSISELKAIEAWALQFKSKSTIIAKFSKAMLLHHKLITGDIETIKNDFAAGEYMESGRVAADLVKIVLGPVDVDPSTKLMTKVSDTVDCSSDADKAAWAKVSPNLGNDVSACAGLSTPYKCTSIFKMNGPCVASCMEKTQGFSSTCSAAFGDLAVCGFKNCKTACISGDPNSESCVKCNEQKCDPAFHAATGFEVACKYDMNCNGDSKAVQAISPKSVPLFVAGLLDSFVEENNLTEIEACYNGGHSLEGDLAKALKAAEAKEWSDAIAAIKDFTAALPAELDNCQLNQLQDDVSAIKAWAKIFSDKTKLTETIAKNLLLHRGKIEGDVTTIKDDWTAEKYFDSGKAAGDALILALGPVHPAHPKNHLNYLQ